MHLIRDEPPLIREIDAVFHTKGMPGVCYCWGHQIFVPIPPDPTQAIIEHERIHAKQQEQFVDDDGERGISAWWMRYIRDPAFRLDQEIPAHQAEYAYWARQSNANLPTVGWRSRKQKRLHFVATRLAGPLYGGLMSLSEAKRVIADGRG